jgi:hypothetical protein
MNNKTIKIKKILTCCLALQLCNGLGVFLPPFAKYQDLQCAPLETKDMCPEHNPKIVYAEVT